MTYNETLDLARAYAHEFNTDMAGYLEKTHTLTLVLNQNSHLSREDVLTIQHDLLKDTPIAIGIGIIFEPQTFDGKDARYANTTGHDVTGRFATYWNRLNGSESLIPIVDIETSDWYTIPKRTLQPIVMEPLIYEGVLMTSYISPIIRNNSFTGTVGIDVPLENLDRTVSQISIFDTGYAFLVSNQGTFVSYPKREYIGRMSLSDLSRDTGNPDIAAMADDIRIGKEGYIETVDSLTGKRVVMFYSPITTGNWSMVMVAPTDEMLAQVSSLGTLFLIIGAFAIILAGGIIFFVARSISGPIVDMSRKADHIASGDLTVRVPVGKGELGILASAFNGMTTRLQDLIGTLEEKISELEHTRQALEESEALFRSVVESSPTGMYFYHLDDDDNLILTNANPATERITGLSLKSLIGKTIVDIFPELIHTDTLEKHRDVASGKTGPQAFELIYSDKYFGGSFAINIFQTSPRNIVVDFTDISARKKAEETIQLARHKLALMTDITYQDIQNKVTAMRGYVDLSKEMRDQATLTHIIQHEESILASIYDLIIKTKDYQHMGEDKLRWVPLEKTIRMQTSFLNKKPDIPLLIKVNNLEIYTDPMIDRVFYHILDNAVRHGETLTHISFSCQETPEGICLICEDDGVGIPYEEKEIIFERVVGAGKFGLFFVKEFLSLSGMSIQETGEPGKGARFEIRIPKGGYRFASKS